MSKFFLAFNNLLEVLALYFKAKERTYKYNLERKAQEEISQLRIQINKLRASDKLEDKEAADELVSLLEHRVKRTKQILANEISDTNSNVAAINKLYNS